MEHRRPSIIAEELKGTNPGVQELRQLGYLAASYYAESGVSDFTNAPDLNRLDSARRERAAREFHQMIEIERHLQSDEIEYVLSPRASGQLRRMTRRYHDALPFVPVELDWLVESYGELEDKRSLRGDYRPSFKALRVRQGYPVVLGGRHDMDIAGKELTNRWWDWRRSVGEFAVYGSYGFARNIVRELGEDLTGESIPRSTSAA